MTTNGSVCWIQVKIKNLVDLLKEIVRTNCTGISLNWPVRGQNVGCPGSRRHSTFFTGTQLCILSSRQGTLLKLPGI